MSSENEWSGSRLAISGIFIVIRPFEFVELMILVELSEIILPDCFTDTVELTVSCDLIASGIEKRTSKEAFPENVVEDWTLPNKEIACLAEST